MPRFVLRNDPVALKTEIEDRYKTKTHKAPEKPGLYYIGGPVMRGGAPDMKVYTKPPRAVDHADPASSGVEWVPLTLQRYTKGGRASNIPFPPTGHAYAASQVWGGGASADESASGAER
jgi:hypothetical protein